MERNMDIEEILSQWKIDGVIDKTELGDESIKKAKLHHKYYEILIKERLKLKKLDSQLRSLKFEKYEYFTQGASEEHIQKGWKPLRKIIIKSEVSMYMDADEDIINMNLCISEQQEKVDLLMDILKVIHNRGFDVRNAIEWQKFTMGG
jgi:hypothetical protein